MRARSRKNLYIIVRTYVHELNANNRGDRKWVWEGIGILEREDRAIEQGLAIIDKAIVVAKPLEDVRVDEVGRAEPSTAQTNAGDVAACEAHIHYLYCVGGNSTWEWGCGSLAHFYVLLATPFPPYPLCFGLHS